jgi:Sec-independent protein translocase protein TatA
MRSWGEKTEKEKLPQILLALTRGICEQLREDDAQMQNQTQTNVNPQLKERRKENQQQEHRQTREKWYNSRPRPQNK